MGLSEDDIHKMATERVAFKQHVATYVIVNAMLVVVWYVTDRGYFWPMWPLLGWGVGLAFHGFGAYGPQKGMVAREEAKLRQKYS